MELKDDTIKMVQHDSHLFYGAPDITVIIPVYKVEKYLSECLDSLIAQTFKNWEAILVDDGSPDNCGEICDEYSSRDPRFRVIHKENGGVASARNVAFPYIRGKYVAFIDSDDRVEPDYLWTLLNLARTHNADIVQCGFVKEYDGFSRKKPLVKEIKILQDHEIILNAWLQDRQLPSFLWNKLYKREVVTEKFPEGKNYEDFAVLTTWSKRIKKAVLSPVILYHYRMRKGSITSDNTAVSQRDFLEAFNERAEHIHKLMPEKFTAEDKNLYLYKNYIKRAKSIARKEKDIEKRKESVARISDEIKKLTPPTLSQVGWKKRFRGRLLANNPEKFIRLMRLVNYMDFHSRFLENKQYD